MILKNKEVTENSHVKLTIEVEQEVFAAPSDEYVDELLAYFRDEAGMDVEILGRL